MRPEPGDPSTPAASVHNLKTVWLELDFLCWSLRRSLLFHSCPHVSRCLQPSSWSLSSSRAELWVQRANWTFRPHQLKLTLTHFTFMYFNLQLDPQQWYIFKIRRLATRTMKGLFSGEAWRSYQLWMKWQTVVMCAHSTESVPGCGVGPPRSWSDWQCSSTSCHTSKWINVGSSSQPAPLSLPECDKGSFAK